jgi:hypothetical protein
MAKPIETLSPTDEAIFRTATLKSLQGAAEDPERIGAEYLPEVLPSASIELSDDSAVTKPVGYLGGDGAGRAVVHDNVRVGGRPLMFDDSLPTQHGLAYKSGDFSTGEDEYFLELGQIVIPADKFLSGGYLFFGLDLNVSLVSVLNLTDFALNIIAPGQTIGQSIRWDVPTAPGSTNPTYVFSGMQRIEFIDLGAAVEVPNLALVGQGLSLITIPAASGNALGAKVDAAPDYFNQSMWHPNSLATLRLGIYMKTSNSILAGGIFAQAKWTYTIP